MKITAKLSLVLSIVALTLLSIGIARAQAPVEGMATFFDSEIPGIRVQVNATSQTQPTKNVTVYLSLTAQTNVQVEHFALELLGFLNGSIKMSIANITDSDFQLASSSREYNLTIRVPDQVSGILYGEIRLTYSASLGGLELTFPNVTSGFPMTQVENTFLEDLENQLKNLSASHNQLTESYVDLTSSFQQLNRTYWELYDNYTSVEGGLVDLDNTRRLTTILGITTVFFVATTAYLVIRRPKEIW